MKIRKVIFGILAIVWMSCIFMFSAQEADESTELSHNAGKAVGEIFVQDFEEWTPEEQESFAAAIDYPVRKTAHASEYAFLSLLLAGALVNIKSPSEEETADEAQLRKAMKQRLAANLSMVFFLTAFYAATDEFHQLFVNGRSGSPVDVLIDSSGALVAMIILFAILSLVKINKEVGKKMKKL